MLHENLLAKLTELRQIYIPDNFLETLPERFFCRNQKLEVVWLYRNKLRYLSPYILYENHKLTFVDLKGNQCIDKDYRNENFVQMWDDLKNNCSYGRVKISTISSSKYREPRSSKNSIVVVFVLVDIATMIFGGYRLMHSTLAVGTS